MSTNEQRRQWAEHIADEGRELASQQRAAGGTHSPTETPQPFTATQLDAAVAIERQRCAALAESWCAPDKLVGQLGALGPAELRAAVATAQALARAIRAGEAPAPGRPAAPAADAGTASSP